MSVLTKLDMQDTAALTSLQGRLGANLSHGRTSTALKAVCPLQMFSSGQKREKHQNTAQRTQDKRITLNFLAIPFECAAPAMSWLWENAIWLALQCSCDPAASKRSLFLASGSAEDPSESYLPSFCLKSSIPSGRKEWAVVEEPSE